MTANAPPMHDWPPPEPPRVPMSAGRAVSAALLVTAVALAFADASVVALALPDLYAEFDTSIVGVSWVLTTYAVVVAAVSVLVAIGHRRLAPRPLVLAGTAVFAASSLVAGAASSLGLLLAGRGGQGVGAALLLAGSLPVLSSLTGSDRRARRWWGLAAAAGAAVGPALGGVLTQLFDWRAIFFVQAPVVAAALVAGVHGSAGRTNAPEGVRAVGRSTTIAANAAFGLIFAALVGALFLGVLLAIEVWRYSPIQGALLVSGLPLGMMVARLLSAVPGLVAAVGGSLLLAAGLVALGLLPGEAPALAAMAFVFCGAGFDLVGEVLEPAAIPEGTAVVRASATSVGARHAGLVLGLVLIAPVLAASLDRGVERATLGATRSMLEADLELREKLPVAWALRTAIEDAPTGQVPDLDAVFIERGAESDERLDAARDGLVGTVTEAITRSFRPAFVVAAMFAALAAIPAAVVAARRRRAGGSSNRRLASIVAVGVLGAGAATVLAVELADGALTVGEFEEADPCTAAPDTYPGDGIDAAVQRIALSALNGAACELDTSRERLVLSLDPDSGYDDVTWDEAKAEEALRVGARRAIADADDRDSIPGFVATVLRFAVDNAPIGWLTDRLPLPG